MINLANLISEARIAAGLTQRQLSKLTGISRSTIQRLETGESPGQWANVVAIAKATKKPLDYFNDDSHTAASNELLNPLQDTLKKMPLSTQKVLISQFNELAKLYQRNE